LIQIASNGMALALPSVPGFQQSGPKWRNPAQGAPPGFGAVLLVRGVAPQSDLRFLVNCRVNFFEFPGTPVRIALREKANPFTHQRKRRS
jgi:predicted GTPase